MLRRMIDRPIAVTMIMIAVIVLGLVAMGKLPISLMPAVDIPQVTIRVNAPDKSARELQLSISGMMQELRQTNHLIDIRAETKDGAGLIYMQFEYGKNIDYIFIDVNERVDRSRSYIDKGIESVTIVKASATDIPVFYLNLTLDKKLADGLTPTAMENRLIELSDFAATVVSKRLEQLQQIAFVDMTGRLYPEIVIEPYADKLEAIGVGMQAISDAIKNSNVDFGNLTVRDGQYEYNIRFNANITGKSDIENIPVNIQERIYMLKDLAQISIRPQSRQEYVRSDGAHAISLAVIKQSDARMDDLRKAVTELIDVMEQDYIDIDFTVTRDQTELLDYSIDNMKDNLLIGAILACLMIFLFMHDFRSPLLITITIPLSLLVSLLFFFVVGISINIISLSGLMLGLGMMVDNSIIVIDNISQRWDRGDSLRDAVATGAGEVFSAMLSSVLTTCSIFVPLIFMSGIAGAMFYDQAMAVSIGLISSLIVAITVIPVYYHLFYRNKDKRSRNRIIQKIGVGDMSRPYEKSLKWVFRHQLIVWTIVVLVTIGGFLTFGLLEKRMLPEMEKSDAILYVNWNARITPSENDSRVGLMIDQIGSQIDQYISMAGRHRFILPHTSNISGNESLVYIKTDGSANLQKAIATATGFIRGNYPDAVMESRDAGNIFEMIFADDKPMLVARLRTRDKKAVEPDKLNPLLGSINTRLPEIYIEPVVWQENIALYANRERMALYKVPFENLKTAIKTALNENKIHSINTGQYSLPVIIGEEPATIEDILSIKTVKSTDGLDVPLNVIIVESQDRDLRSIVSGQEGDYYPLNLHIESAQVPKVREQIIDVVAENPDFEVSFSGGYFDNIDTMKQLALILTIGLLLLYFILASQFESLVQPFIILSEIVVDLAGALLFLWIFGSSLNLMSMIGLVIMCGIVINDSILKVDTFNRLRKEGYSTIRTIITGGDRRLKPIIMTSLTTILAIVPFLFSGGMGNDLQRPLSLSIIGGMTIGTIVSIYCIPLLYYYIYRNK